MATVKAIPNGFSTVTPFFNIKGASEAIEFYKKAFGAEESDRMATPDGTVMHSQLKIGQSFLFISEAIQYPATNSSCMLYVEDADAWWKRATAAGCEVKMPLAKQFWGDKWGLLTDKWGNRWGIATRVEDVSPDELQKRAAEEMKKSQSPMKP